ncbi:hypothetical protein KIN20_016329 [Parelaphostrongylus tenuis]|uniref:PDZ domain-containing protein n=1 Tax=Parelaphostrongylus tenuis TaxID=148309 RepID=A0AAD5MZM7_PARTN|nr:hypothetical protein KIN20_016329 [Parelaphostrongylus tenuis]
MNLVNPEKVYAFQSHPPNNNLLGPTAFKSTRGSANGQVEAEARYWLWIRCSRPAPHEGPSDGILFANDQILEVNGFNVTQETKDSVVTMIRSCEDDLLLTVEQLPARPRSSRRSCRVRFTDRVLIASMPDSSPELLPPLPNALRIYLENGQTRSFRYDDTTTVKDIMNSIFAKLQLTAKSYFALASEYSLGARSSRVSLLRSETKVDTITRMPNSDHLRCVFRFAFIPKEIEKLWAEDPRALDYFYQQCVSDVVRGRYAFEMR